MRRLLIGLAFVGLAACTTLPDALPPASSLVGTWLPLENGIIHPLACASGLPIAYQADGRYLLFEEEGRWSLTGTRLTEIATAATEAGDPAEVALGQPFVSTLRFLGPDRFRKRLADGSQVEFRRCPSPR